MTDQNAASRTAATDGRERLVRYAELAPCRNAFIDSRTPGSETKENFTIIGPGVSENPEQHVHIAEPHGFNIGGARQPPNCVNSQHSHTTAEVFVAHSGYWRFDAGEHGTDARVEIGPGDVISLPTGMFRGFTNVGAETGFLWSVLGGDDPGRVTWAPQVFELAHDYGLILLESGRLIDTRAGQVLDAGDRPMPPTSAAQVAAMMVPTKAALEACMARAAALDAAPALHEADGVRVVAVIGGEGPLTADGFTMRRATMGAGGHSRRAATGDAEVLFCHEGSVTVTMDETSLMLGKGDTLSVPAQVSLQLASERGATLFSVRRGA